MAANLMVALTETVARVRVVGRANFQNSEDLKLFCHQAIDGGVSAVAINLRQCEGMDSTFMGMLAMISLSAREKTIPLQMVNAGDTNKGLLSDLGLDTMLEYLEEEENSNDWQDFNKTQSMSQAQHSENILDAHEALMDISEANREEFKDVVKFLKEQEGR